MEVTLTLSSVGHFLLILAAIVLLVTLVVVAIKLIGTLKKLDVVLDDVSVITSTAADKAQDLDNIVSNVSSAAVNLSSSLKANPNMVKAAGSLVNSLAVFKGAVKKDKKEKNKEEEKGKKK